MMDSYLSSSSSHLPSASTKASPQGMSKEGDKDDMAGAQVKAFTCNYCDRIFPTSQALGGHQNGHRREREVVKRVQRHAQLLANPMHPSHRMTASPYLDGSSSCFYSLSNSSHLLPPMYRVNPNPPPYQPYPLLSNCFGERKAAHLADFGDAVRVHEMPQPVLTLGRPFINFVNSFSSSSSHGGEDQSKYGGKVEDKCEELDLNLHL